MPKRVSPTKMRGNKKNAKGKGRKREKKFLKGQTMEVVKANSAN